MTTTHHDHSDDATLANLLDLDGEVLRSYWSAALLRVRDAARGPCRRILDLGAGTGTGTIALAQRFADAEVVAVDSSEAMLERIRGKALDLGLASRVRTVRADLDVDWPDLAPLDLTWASLSLHHHADPDAVLGQVYAATRPGGVLAVAEFGARLRFLPDDVGVGRPGLETRCLDALEVERAHALPEIGSDWSARLVAAGFALVEERTFDIDLAPSPAGRAGRYAQHWLRRLRAGLASQLAPDDVAALDLLIDGDEPESVLRRTDLQVRGSRIVTLARRP